MLGPPAWPPSPKSHTVRSCLPSGSRAADENCTGSGAVPDRGVAAICTVGGWLAGGPSTTIVISAVSNAPSASVAVTVAV